MNNLLIVFPEVIMEASGSNFHPMAPAYRVRGLREAQKLGSCICPVMGTEVFLTFQYRDHLSFCIRGLIFTVIVEAPPLKRRCISTIGRASWDSIICSVESSDSSLPSARRLCSFAGTPTNHPFLLLSATFYSEASHYRTKQETIDPFN